MSNENKTSALYNVLTLVIAIVAILLLAFNMYSIAYGATIFSGVIFSEETILPVITSLMSMIAGEVSTDYMPTILMPIGMTIIAVIFAVISFVNLIISICKVFGFLKFKEEYEDRKSRFIRFLKKPMLGIGLMSQLILYSLISPTGLLKKGKLLLVLSCVFYAVVVIFQALMNIFNNEERNVADEIVNCVRRIFFLLIPLFLAFTTIKSTYANLMDVVSHSGTGNVMDIYLAVAKFGIEIILMIIVYVSVRKAFRIGYAEREYTQKPGKKTKNYSTGLGVRAIVLCLFVLVYVYACTMVIPTTSFGFDKEALPALLGTLKTDYLWTLLLVLAAIIVTFVAGDKPVTLGKKKDKATEEAQEFNAAEETETVQEQVAEGTAEETSEETVQESFEETAETTVEDTEAVEEQAEESTEEKTEE